MRALSAVPFAALFLLNGCATTVHRLSEDQVLTAAGPAKTACEKEAWLVLAPTRREQVNENGVSTSKDDGFGMYRVGEDDPESIPAYGEDFGPDPIVARHKAGVKDHDRDRMIAVGLGVASVVSIAVGSVLFVQGLSRTKRVRDQETMLLVDDADPDGTKAAVGALVAGVGGLGFGIAALLVNPDSAERAEADASRYVFTPDEDMTKVKALIDKHNVEVRRKCDAMGQPDEGTAEASRRAARLYAPDAIY